MEGMDDDLRMTFTYFFLVGAFLSLWKGFCLKFFVRISCEWMHEKISSVNKLNSIHFPESLTNNYILGAHHARAFNWYQHQQINCLQFSIWEQSHSGPTTLNSASNLLMFNLFNYKSGFVSDLAFNNGDPRSPVLFNWIEYTTSILHQALSTIHEINFIFYSLRLPQNVFHSISHYFLLLFPTRITKTWNPATLIRSPLKLIIKQS